MYSMTVFNMGKLQARCPTTLPCKALLFSTLCSTKAPKLMTKLIGRRVDRHPVMATYTFNRFLFSKRSSHGDIKYLKIKLDEITTLTPTVPSKADKK